MQPLKIPEYKPLDFSGMEDIPRLYQAARKAAAQEDSLRQNAETQKKYADNQDKKLSADLARSQWEMSRQYDADQHQRAVETSNAIPDIYREATHGKVAQANAQGQPYGISFDQQDVKGPPPGVDPELAPSAEAAAFLQKGGVTAPAGKDDPLLGPDTHPTQDPETSGDMPAAASQDEAPALDLGAETAMREAAIPTTRHLYSTVHGSRQEIQPAAPSHLFDEPQYNAKYDELVGGGVSDKDAAARVETQRGHDMGEGGKNTRAQAALGQKQNTQLTREERLAEQEAALAQSDTNNKRSTNATITAAGIRANGGPSLQGVDPKILNAYNSYSKAAQAAALMKQDQQGMRMFDRIAAELDPNNPNPLNQQMANHSLAAISVSTGGSAGRVPVSVIHDVRNAYSLATSAKNWVYKQTHNGENLPEVTAIMSDAQGKLRALSVSERENDYQVWDHKAGHASPWAQSPETRPLVDSEAESVRAQLHLPPRQAPPEAAPTPAPRHHAPAPHGIDPMRAKAQKALNDPNAPPEAKAAAHKFLGM